MDPNSANQRWSYWVFDVHEGARHVPFGDVKYNAARWVRAGFGSAGEMRVRSTVFGWRIEVRIEGPDAHDPVYLASVRSDFARKFVAAGWGPMAWGTVHARLLAGRTEDGTPSQQWVTLPHLLVK